MRRGHGTHDTVQGSRSARGPIPLHNAVEAEIWIIEGLDLSEVEPGEHELVCLPIKIERSDGAPARAILKAT